MYQQPWIFIENRNKQGMFLTGYTYTTTGYYQKRREESQKLTPKVVAVSGNYDDIIVLTRCSEPIVPMWYTVQNGCDTHERETCIQHHTWIYWIPPSLPIHFTRSPCTVYHHVRCRRWQNRYLIVLSIWHCPYSLLVLLKGSINTTIVVDSMGIGAQHGWCPNKIYIYAQHDMIHVSIMGRMNRSCLACLAWLGPRSLLLISNQYVLNTCQKQVSRAWIGNYIHPKEYCDM